MDLLSLYINVLWDVVYRTPIDVSETTVCCMIRSDFYQTIKLLGRDADRSLPS